MRSVLSIFLILILFHSTVNAADFNDTVDKLFEFLESSFFRGFATLLVFGIAIAMTTDFGRQFKMQAIAIIIGMFMAMGAPSISSVILG